jgi:hypothetical protein
MKLLFKKNVLQKIKDNEAPPIVKNNFLSQKECKYFLNLFRNMKIKSIGKNKFVNREESTKIFFDFNKNKATKIFKEKLQDELGEFFINDFQPHLITSRFPLRLHIDSGKNPNDLIYKNVVLPLEIIYDKNKKKNKEPNTIVFKNKWYGESALFTKIKDKKTDFIIKDKHDEFVDILDIHDLYNKIKKLDNSNFIYRKKEFFINKRFRDYIGNLSKLKRFNIRTNKHIINNKNFDKKNYNKYMSHQPYEDCKSLVIDKVIPWKIGSLAYWDRTRIHSSDNFLKNNVLSKTCIALFTSKNKI